MKEPISTRTDVPISQFLSGIADDQVRRDCEVIAKLMEAATQCKGEMWGPGIVGFGRRPIHYANGRTQEWMMIGFAPRKQNLALYLPGGLEGREEILNRMGKHSCGKGCLYIKNLSVVDVNVLKELIETSVREAGPCKTGSV